MTASTIVLPPTKEDAGLAGDSRRRLERYTEGHEVSSVKLIIDDGSGEAILLPTSVFRLIVDVLRHMERGDALSLVPVHAELTTQQAADLLGVSRPYLIKLLDHDEIPFRRVGRHRRIRFADLMAYKSHTDHRRDEALDELVHLSSELGLYD